MRSLAGWETQQRDQLSSLQTSIDQSMLVELLRTSCLLELSKLSPTQLDLGAYTRSALEVLTQFFPLAACDLRVDVSGLPSMRARFGEIDATRSDECMAACAERAELTQMNAAVAHPIVLDGTVAGVLAIWPAGDGLDVTPLLRAVSDQIASGLAIVAETERLRRKSAADTAMRLAASLDERSGEEHLEELIAAIAALPGVTGASLHVDSPIFHPAVAVLAGILEGTTTTSAETDFADEGHFRLLVTWAGAPDAHDDARLEAIFTTLATSLARAERNRRLLEEAETDPLTGLANRRRLSRGLAAAINRAERHGEPVAVIALDLDSFKAVNDGLGHDVGDAVLETVASVLGHEVRSYDIAGRTGGDEFLVILPQTDSLGAAAFARRVLARITAECRPHLPPEGLVTASMGVAVFPNHADYPEAILRAADEALYAAKKSGRNQVVVVSQSEAA